METDDRLDAWFLTASERGNPASALPAWSEGNQVHALAHGAEYFDRLVTAVEAMRSGDQLFLTDWRGDPDQRLRPSGPTVGVLLSRAARRGVLVRGLVWRSHLDVVHYHAEQNRGLSDDVLDDGGHLLLDQRLRKFGSHHQKLVVLRHPGRPDRDRAFVGGIDLCHSRRDNATHLGIHRPWTWRPRTDRPHPGTTASLGYAVRWSQTLTCRSGNAGTTRPGCARDIRWRC